MRGMTSLNIEGNENAKGNSATEQRTSLSVQADFSDEVSANITLDSYGFWGGNSREGDNVQLHEAYITLGDAVAGFDLKIGRQEVLLGSEFIIGNNSTAGSFDHMSFDGIRGDYAGENFNVTLLSLKIDENDGFNSNEVDQDDDLYAIYATYNGIENHTIDGYVFLERSGITGASNSENGELYTIGARAAGTFGSFDYELEIATQSGQDSSDTDYEGLAVNSVLGYTFDSNMQPRVWLGFALLTGDDEDNGFTRNYSDWEFSEFLGDGEESNLMIIRAGVSANVTEKIGLSAVVSSFTLEEEDDGNGIYNGFNVTTGEDDLGLEIGLYATYQYSEDVAMEVGAAQFLNGDSIEDAQGDDEDDQTYVYAEISLSF